MKNVKCACCGILVGVEYHSRLIIKTCTFNEKVEFDCLNCNGHNTWEPVPNYVQLEDVEQGVEDES